jgi:hypothetical protein
MCSYAFQISHYLIFFCLRPLCALWLANSVSSGFYLSVLLFCNILFFQQSFLLIRWFLISYNFKTLFFSVISVRSVAINLCVLGCLTLCVLCGQLWLRLCRAVFSVAKISVHSLV